MNDQPLGAQQYLELLRAEIDQLYPTVVAVQSEAARQIGEDRYKFRPGNSLYVQAPVTTGGLPRRRGDAWRTCPNAHVGWSYHQRFQQVVDLICRMAAASSHQPAPPASPS